MYAIWLPMLPGDERSEWDAGVLDEPRVVSLWDQHGIAGEWFADHEIGGKATPGSVLWDAYLAFDRRGRWAAEPTRLVASGSPIIGETDALEGEFVPLLERS